MLIRLSKITMFLIMFVSISYICFANTEVVMDAEQVWETRFSSNLANSCDRTVSLTSDNDGNVYVAGRSTSQPYGVDYLIAKYDQVGTLLWEARYNGIGNGEDLVEDIQVDNNGNVYVTGASLGDETGYNIATVKYDSNGIQQWEAIWTGISDTDYDFGHSIAIDNSGNVYVTGVTGFLGSSTEFIILKYNNNGEQEWEQFFEGVVQVKDQAPNINIDSEDYIYVTGSSQGQTSLDYTIIKYNQEGVEQWAAFYNSPANQNDELHATTLDDSGNIYVTGASFNQNYSTDLKIVKFNSDGIFQWEASFNGSGDYDDDGRDIAIDNEGNIFVIGWSANSNFMPEYVTLKYDSSGTLLWSASYDGEMGYENYANALTLDSLGNVLVTGSSMNANGMFDYATVKYDTNGNEEWVAIYDSPVEKDDQANGITVTENSIWVMGLSEKGPSDYDYSVIKYDYSGNEQIIVNYNGPGSSVDQTTKLAF